MWPPCRSMHARGICYCVLGTIYNPLLRVVWSVMARYDGISYYAVALYLCETNAAIRLCHFKYCWNGRGISLVSLLGPPRPCTGML